MLEDLTKEIRELQDYKRKYECALADKKRMSDELYAYMMDEYNRTSYEDRAKSYIKDMCRCCIWKPWGKDKCDMKLPEDIRLPIQSDKAYFPSKKTCGRFEWD